MYDFGSLSKGFGSLSGITLNNLWGGDGMALKYVIPEINFSLDSMKDAEGRAARDASEREAKLEASRKTLKAEIDNGLAEEKAKREPPPAPPVGAEEEEEDPPDVETLSRPLNELSGSFNRLTPQYPANHQPIQPQPTKSKNLQYAVIGVVGVLAIAGIGVAMSQSKRRR